MTRGDGPVRTNRPVTCVATLVCDPVIAWSVRAAVTRAPVRQVAWPRGTAGTGAAGGRAPAGEGGPRGSGFDQGSGNT